MHCKLKINLKKYILHKYFLMLKIEIYFLHFFRTCVCTISQLLHRELARAGVMARWSPGVLTLLSTLN